MALILPENAAPPTEATAARLEATLVSLPDEWLLLPDREIGAGGPRVAFLLLHPEIGIALVDLAPAALHDASAALKDLLAVEKLLDAEDELPIVTVAVASADIPAMGERLAEAFDAAPPCAVRDGGWTRRVSGLLLHAEDAAMAPLPRGEPVEAPARVLSTDEDEGPYRDDAPRRRVAMSALAAAALLFIGAGGAIAYLSSEPAPDPVAPTESSPLPALPGPSQAAAAAQPAPAPAPIAAAQETLPQSLSSPAPPSPALAETAPQPAPPATAAAMPAPLPPDPAVASTAPAPDLAPSEPAAAPPPAPIAKPVPQETAHKEPAHKEAAHGEKTHVDVAAKKPPKEIRAPERRIVTATPPKPQPKPAERQVASVDARKAAAAPPPDEDDGPPLDVSDLPPLEASGSDLPPGTPVGLAGGAPFSAGPPAIGKPVMLLPPVAPPVGMPAAPSAAPFAGSLVAAPAGR